MWKPTFFLSVIFYMHCAYGVMARGTCNISENKKQVINSVLCGQMAQESEYRFYGPNCASNSIKRRMDDSAIQVASYALCGDSHFSHQLQEGNIRSVEFMQILSVCTPESFDIRKIFENALRDARDKAKNFSCTSEFRQRLDQRRSHFSAMIEQSKSSFLLETIYSKIGIKVDTQGNISEK